ncbi:Gamma-tubulin complex component 5 [Physocladia obscura]|uniref:Gamma-tubulin complex component 5 n=1 Tax=Physocladia obscura TaxID=109957 RepID=A0AAD5XH92_9FUNG|nr:Gamma-tubulin complex component 5 [Physocladia obscura]
MENPSNQNAHNTQPKPKPISHSLSNAAQAQINNLQKLVALLAADASLPVAPVKLAKTLRAAQNLLTFHPYAAPNEAEVLTQYDGLVTSLNPDTSSSLAVWSNILRDDPLVGDHWASVDYSSTYANEYSDYSDTDDNNHNDFEVKKTPQNFATRAAPSVHTLEITGGELSENMPGENSYSNIFDPNSVGLVTPPIEEIALSNDPKLAKVIDSHYWDHEKNGYRRSKLSVGDLTEFDMDVPDSLAPSIAHHQSIDPSFFGVSVSTTNYVTELDVIREVLFCLSGLPAEMFELANGSIYQPKMIACLRHLTVEMLDSVLQKFSEWGTIVYKLQILADRIHEETGEKFQLFSPCLEAFASVINDALSVHQTWIVQQQQHYFQETHADGNKGIFYNQENGIVVSLLVLLERTSSEMAHLEELYLIVVGASPNIDGQEIIAVDLVDSVFQFVRNEQEACNIFSFKRGIVILFKVLKPWFDAVEGWWIDGNTISRIDGLGFICNERILVGSANFWTSKFLIQERKNGSMFFPQILCETVGSILSIGKCLVMLRELNPELISDLIPDLRNGIFLPLLNIFSNLLAIDLGKKSNSVLQEPLNSTMEEHITTVASSPELENLLLFRNLTFENDMLIPEKFSKLAPILNGNSINKSNLANEQEYFVRKWYTDMENAEIGHQQLWRPFEIAFRRSLEMVLHPKSESIGNALRNQLLGPQCQLLVHLQTCQQVFLMASGIIMGLIVDDIAEKMKSGELWRRPGVLQSAFDASIAAFSAFEGEEWIAESERIVLLTDDTNVPQELKKWNAAGHPIKVGMLGCVKIGYDVSWPLNCVITQKHLKLYNKALVFLMQLSMARNRLDKHSLSFDKLRNGSVTGWMRQRNVLRRRMKVFCEGLTSFSMITVIQPAIKNFMEGVVKFHDLDELNNYHESFLTDICDHFFLLNEKAAPVLNSIYKCFDLCIKFSEICTIFDSNVQSLSKGGLSGQQIAVTPQLKKTDFITGKQRISSSPTESTVSSPPSSPIPGKHQLNSKSSPPNKLNLRSSSPSSMSSRFQRQSSQNSFGKVVSPLMPKAVMSLSVIGLESTDSIEAKISLESESFGNAVKDIFKLFDETEDFVVNSVTALSSHGMPKLSAFGVFLRGNEIK